MKIALIYDSILTSGPGGAASVHGTWTTGDASAALLTAQGALLAAHEVLLIANDIQMEDRLLAFWPDMVINLAEANADLELLERWHIPFTGSSQQTLRTCLDHSTSRRVLQKHGLPTPLFMVVQSPEEMRRVERFPLLVKPLYEGETLPLDHNAIVYNDAELLTRVRWVLATYDQPALVETSLSGREFMVSLLGNGPEVQVLPLVEPEVLMLPAESLVGVAGDTPAEPVVREQRVSRYRCPAEVSVDLAQDLARLARQAFVALQCHDFCGVSIRLDAEAQPYILEVNPHPRLLPSPDNPPAFLTAVAASRMTYADLIRHVWQLACTRYGLPV